MEWILLSVILLITWCYFTKPLSHWKNKGVKQGKPWPILGDSWRLLIGKAANLNHLNWLYDQRKGIRYFGFYQFSKPALIVYEPDLIKQITIKEFDSFSDHKFGYVDPDVDPHWSNNVLILKGQKWKHMRSTLSPNYTGNKMRLSYELIAETANNFINYFLAKNQDYIEVEMKDTFSRFTNDVIATTAFGLKVDSLNDPNNLFYHHGKKITNFQSIGFTIKFLLISCAPIIWKIFGLTVMNKEQVNYFKEVLFETIQQREEKNIFRPDLINILIEAKKEREVMKTGQIKQAPLSDDKVLAQALIFFFAGFETISSTLSFGAYELALNKEVQDKLRKEIKETYNKHGMPNYEVLQEMKYLDMVVSEILRKWPTFMIVDREVTKPFTIDPVNKNEVPVQLDLGTQIFLPVYHLQRDPRYFPNPEKFDPERFSEENKHNINPYTYIPFGAGPRTCIGNRFALLEIKSLLFNILLHFEFVPTKRTQVPPKIRMPSFQYTMEGGFWLGLKRVKA